MPPEKQGRVFTLMMSGTALMASIGLAVAGPLSEVLGVRAWFLPGGTTIILMGVAAFLVPEIMNLERGNGIRQRTDSDPDYMIYIARYGSTIWVCG